MYIYNNIRPLILYVSTYIFNLTIILDKPNSKLLIMLLIFYAYTLPKKCLGGPT